MLHVMCVDELNRMLTKKEVMTEKQKGPDRSYFPSQKSLKFVSCPPSILVVFPAHAQLVLVLKGW